MDYFFKIFSFSVNQNHNRKYGNLTVYICRWRKKIFIDIIFFFSIFYHFKLTLTCLKETKVQFVQNEICLRASVNMNFQRVASFAYTGGSAPTILVCLIESVLQMKLFCKYCN